MSSMLLVVLILITRQHDYDETAGTMSRLKGFLLHNFVYNSYCSLALISVL